MKFLSFSSLFCFFLLLLSACNKDQTSPAMPQLYDECVEKMLERNDMRPYVDGEELGCQFFFSLYEFQQEYYFLLNNHCADMLLIIEDCQGDRFCGVGPSSPVCSAVFNAQAISLGIVGVSK